MLGYLQRRLIYRPRRERQLLPEDAGLAPETVTRVAIRTHDNLVLNGWRVSMTVGGAAMPPGSHFSNRSSRGLVIYFPGNAKNRKYRGLNFRTLAELQVDVLLVDYRGYAENPGSPKEEHIAADARAIRNYAVEQLAVPASKIVLHGESLGGAVATRLAAEMCVEGTPAAGLILGWTFPTLADAGSYLYPWLPVRRVLVERYASIDHIGDVRCPILMLHGRDDEIVPIHLGRRLFEAAAERSSCDVAKRFVELPSGHNNVYRAAGRELQAAVEPFLAAVFDGNLTVRAVQAAREGELARTPY